MSYRTKEGNRVKLLSELKKNEIFKFDLENKNKFKDYVFIENYKNFYIYRNSEKTKLFTSKKDMQILQILNFKHLWE